MTNTLKLSLLVFLLAGCSAAIDLPTPTSTAQTATTAAAVRTATTAALSPTPQPAPTGQDTCTVSTGVPAGYLNLRSGPGMQFAVIRVLHEGDILTVLERGDWYEVTDAAGIRGFVNSKFCK